MAVSSFMQGSSIAASYRRYYSYFEPIIADPIIRSYFSLIASLLLISFLMFFALSPTVNIILSLQRKIDDQKKVIATLDTKVAAIIAAQENYGQVQNMLPLLNQALPEAPLPQVIISDIHKVATASGVNISLLQFKTIPISANAPLETAQTVSAASEPVPTVAFSLSVSGDAQKVREFLGNLENQLRYIRSDNLIVTVADRAANRISVDISGAGYYFR